MIKEFEINDILSAVDSISKTERKKSKTIKAFHYCLRKI